MEQICEISYEPKFRIHDEFFLVLEYDSLVLFTLGHGGLWLAKSEAGRPLLEDSPLSETSQQVAGSNHCRYHDRILSLKKGRKKRLLDVDLYNICIQNR